MKKEDYHAKMLDTGTYKQLKKDPTATQETRIVTKLRNLEKTGEIPAALYARIRPTGSKPPMLYGLPKIHKPDVPLRPIVSCIGSPTYGLSKHIASLLSPLAGKSDYYVKNSEHFINAIDDITLEQDDVLVSYDVRSLFTNVPVDEAIEVIFGMLVDDESLLDRTTLDARRIADLLELCLKSTYFGYQGMFYEQLEGAAINGFACICCCCKFIYGTF